ncbi:MAG: DUF362 domain-containing protein [Clostridia bacterium]|nr:DUF362 domain-containing protein [Clostridia bacterium]MDY5555731.1 DUF362 domain-containing protein [Blautia sp.]
MKSKVVLLPCGEYEEQTVYELLKEGLKLLGGLDTLIPRDKKILLKPNLLKRAEVEKAVITHPVVVGAFARILREEGYENIILADSCGHGSTHAVIRDTGMDTYLDRYKIPAVDYSEGVHVEYPQGIQAKEFVLPKELLEQDCIVSLCKMKTHALERVTGAVKNSYGFVYGLNKTKGHTQYPSADSFARMLVDLTRFVHPDLYIMDGIVAMEGNGPGSGDPVHMNVMLMSLDPVALDSVFCHLIYLDPEMVPTNYHGEKMGLGTFREDQITLLTPDGEISMSEAVQKYGNPDFNVDRTIVRRNIWTRMARALNIFQKKPYIDTEKCIRCGICVQSCPVPGKAVDFTQGRDKPPVYNYKKCIRCFCCQEMCPRKAIKVK